LYVPFCASSSGWDLLAALSYLLGLSLETLAGIWTSPVTTVLLLCCCMLLVAQDLRQAAAAVQRPSQASSDCRAQANTAGSAPTPDHQQAAASDHADQQQLGVVPLQQQGECQLQDAMQRQQEQQEQVCALDAAAVKSIKAGRQRFLRHQAMLDGTLHDLGSNSQLDQGSAHKGAGGRGATASRGSRGVLQPDQVVEAVADLLLEELLLQEAQDLDGFCDALCDQLVEDELREA
jgi:hypothetical protein